MGIFNENSLKTKMRSDQILVWNLWLNLPELIRNGSIICPWIADVLETSIAMSFGSAVAVVNASNERGLHFCVHFPEGHSNEEEYKSKRETQKPFAVAVHCFSLDAKLLKPSSTGFQIKSSWRAALWTTRNCFPLDAKLLANWLWMCFGKHHYE